MQIFIAYKDENGVEVLDKYTIESVAEKGVINHAVAYIESQVGKRNSVNCIQLGLNVDEINANSELGEGFYLIKDMGKVTVVYKKKNIVHDKKQEITYVPTTITEVVPEEVEVVVIEKVIKKVPTSSSYIGYYMGYSEEVEKEVDEKVIKKFTLYNERETVINKEEIMFVYEKKKFYTTTPVCNFGIISIDIDWAPANSSTLNANTSFDDKIMVDKKKIKEIQSNYMSELVSLLQNGSIIHTLKKVSRN